MNFAVFWLSRVFFCVKEETFNYLSFPGMEPYFQEGALGIGGWGDYFADILLAVGDGLETDFCWSFPSFFIFFIPISITNYG